MDRFTYLGSSVSSTKNDINIQLEKAWTAINRLSVTWKSDLTDKIKRFFSKQRSCRYCYMKALHRREQYWTSPGGNTPQNSSCTATYHPSRKLFKFNEPDVRDTAGEVSDALLWTPSHWWAKAGRPARTYIPQLCADTGCSLEDLPGVMDERDG